MMRMSIGYELAGRTRQKQRTRQALVAAARALVADGVTPTVEDAAEAAGVSRTTAYRYFPNQRALVAAAHPEVEAQSLLPRTRRHDVAARLDAVIDAFHATDRRQRAAAAHDVAPVARTGTGT